MEKPSSRRGPQRQETLGPSAPIWDWEVERANLRTECREYRRKAEQLEKELKEDRQTYEKNTSSLLREIKLKESVMEKKMNDMEQQFMAQSLELQKQLDEEKLSRQEIIQDIHTQHEAALQAEERKYQRRLASLRERLDAKDREYAEILRNREDEANTFVPQTIDKQTEVDVNDKSTMTEEKKTALENGSLQDMVLSLQINSKEEEEKIDAIISLLPGLEERRKKEEDHLRRVHELEAALKIAQEDSQKYKKRLDQSHKMHDAEIRELTEKFTTEARLSEMTFQARMQNLQSEQADTIRELKEHYETQQEVMQIEHEAALEELRRMLDFEKAEAIRELNRDWREQMEDIKASMSKDTTETQTHWEAKVEETKAKMDRHIKRLQGEIEVVKDRLGQEIQRRKQYQNEAAHVAHNLDVAVVKAETSMKKRYKELRNDYRCLQDRVYSLELERKKTLCLARDLLEMFSPTVSKPIALTKDNNLNDTLRDVMRHLSIQRFMEHTQVSFDLKNACSMPYIID